MRPLSVDRLGSVTLARLTVAMATMQLERRQRAEMSRTAFAAVASLAPLWALLSFKSRGIGGLRLDNLHVGLAQMIGAFGLESRSSSRTHLLRSS